MISKKISSLIKESIEELQREKKLIPFEIPKIQVERPEEKSFGDYSTNIAMLLAKILEKNPIEVANLLATKLDSQISKLFEAIEVIKPGFINFFLLKKIWTTELKEILKEKEKYGSSKIGKGKTIVIDYSAPNIAKPFSIGHLRSTIIGQVIYNLYKFSGYKVIGDNHIGDWGTQFGKLIFAIKNWGDKKKISQNPIKELQNLYVNFHKEAELKPELEEEARKWFKKLEDGDKEAREIWKKCVKWSLDEFDQVYKLLGVKIDLTLGESFYQPMLKDVIKEAVSKGIAKKSQGAIIISFPNEALPPLMIQKSDGATLYSTRDLATIKYRREKFKPFKIIYEVGADQILYLKQLFWAAELLGWGKRNDYFHVAHGMMRLPTGGKMRTRKGEIILLEEVFKEAVKRAKEIVEKKNPDLNQKEKDKIAKIIGIGAVKYNDLSHHYSNDIIFDWEKILNLEGNSGPYLEYTYARARSILRKSKIKESKDFKESELKEEKEIEVLKLLSQFPEVIERAVKSYSPNLLSNFLFELAKDFNAFYESLSVLNAENEESRLALVSGVCQVLKNGLNLLGIEVLERI